MKARWLPLLAYTAAIFAFLPLGPRVGGALASMPVGAWLLGRGCLVLTVVGVVASLTLLARRGAPAYAYAMLLIAGVGYAMGFSYLRSQHLERTHLPEYGVCAFLAWWAVSPSLPGRVQGYLAAALLAGGIGYADELLQRIVPGRVYDLRDVAMNALGAVLGTIVLAAVRARSRRTAEVARRATAESSPVA